MRKAPVLIALLLLAPLAALSGGAPSFEGGTDEATVSLSAPDFKATANLTIPADYYVKNATLQVTGMAEEGNASSYPDKITMMLSDTVIWDFKQIGFGPLGRQDRFSTDSKEAKLNFGANGGTSRAVVRLPKDANVQSASMQLRYISVKLQEEMINFTGAYANDYFGNSVSSAGDLNGDGYDDVIVGASLNDSSGGDGAGSAYIYFGGESMNGTADVTLSGADASDNFGRSVSGAGDVNKDGYDDVIVGATEEGEWSGYAQIYFGGASMDNTADVTFTGIADEHMGYSVSDAGDVNNDGYDDVIVGAYENSAAGSRAGAAYIFFGGANINSTADVTLYGAAANDYFGDQVSGAGDVNGDGYDDVMVGAARNGAGGLSAGRVYIYFGGANMDSIADVTFTGAAAQDFFSICSDAGDVNNDGYDDVIAGTNFNDAGGTNAGQAYVYFGGANMDNIADVTLTGAAAGDYFSRSVSGAGDVNCDGYDDVIVGASMNDSGGADAGRAYIYFGGANMDSTADVNFTGAAAGDAFGVSVSRAGDVDCNGYDDVIVGATGNDGGGTNAGRAYIYSMKKDAFDSILDPGIAIGQISVWNATGYFNGTASTGDITSVLNDYLRSASASGNDSFGNRYVDVPVNVNAKSVGNIVLSNLSINYQYNASVPNFAPILNNYLSFHQAEKDVFGNINVPIMIQSQSAGRIKLSGVELTRDIPPSMVAPVPNAQLDEDSFNLSLIDLYPYFKDDVDAVRLLNFSVVSATNSSLVRLWISGGRYLSADALNGEPNDNWTGTVEATVSCSDHWGQTTESNQFTITVRNVPDLPVITSSPVIFAEPGVPYSYNVTAVDGDNDILQYSLAKAPPGMAIDPNNGTIEWLPRARGSADVTVSVSDGVLVAQQKFSIGVPNRPPRITSAPPLGAYTGAVYQYNVTAEDDNLDALTYSVATDILGMAINATTGTIYWVPEFARSYDVLVTVSDGLVKAVQEFTIAVAQGNRPPAFKSRPITEATVDTPYSYTAMAVDLDIDALTYSIANGPTGMSIDSATGKVSWKPDTPGNFTVTIEVKDGRGGNASQDFVVKVLPAVRPEVVLLQPPLDRKLTGIVTFSGTVTQGTREVLQVQIRVDEGEWKDVVGNYVWSCKLNTRTLKNGQHSFEFRAYDGKEYSDTLKVAYKVDHPAQEGSSSVLAEASMAGAVVASVTVLGFAYVAYSETAKYKWALFSLPLYTRLQKEALLDNETRGMIRGCISTEPGIHYNAILRNLKLSNGAAAYHLMTLEREGLVRSMSEGRFRRFYPADMKPADVPPSLTKPEKMILETVQESEGISQGDISKQLEIPYATINRHVNKLADAGMLRLERHGMTIKCFTANGKSPEDAGTGQVP